jgi:hypothetical protein
MSSYESFFSKASSSDDSCDRVSVGYKEIAQTHLVASSIQLLLFEELDISATVIATLSKKGPRPPALPLTDTV